MVDRLARQYGCDVNYRRIKDGGTALHFAAYYGHADVVATLLNSGLISNVNLKNKYGETALDCAKAGQAAHDKNKFPSFDLLREFTTRDGWPGWGSIMPRLEAASVVDKTTAAARGLTQNDLRALASLRPHTLH
jgi:hypothetical protein